MTRTNRPDDQIGKALISMPWYWVEKALAAVKSAEEKLMRPPSIFEIFTQMTKIYNLQVATIYEGAAVLTSLFREDWLYMNT